ncbi:MAG: YihY/virulence factor BrkB family protein [Phycisphaerae bacterium]|nr:YihY/virulence factor BrkB family protein [Phycisphaerae bacterium]
MDIGQSVKQLREHLQRLLKSPSDELDRGGRFLVYQIRLWWFCGRKLVKDRLLVTASALSYKTLISIVPLMVIFFLILNAVTPGQDMQAEIKERLFSVLNLNIGATAAEPEMGDMPPEDIEAMDRETVATWLGAKVDDIVKTIQSQGKGTRAPITIISVALMIFTGMSVFSTVEGALNHIWEVRRGRNWFVRLRDFIATIVVVGLLLAVSIYAGHQIRGILTGQPVAENAQAEAAEPAFTSPDAQATAHEPEANGALGAAAEWLFRTLSRIVPLLIGWLVFFILYKTLPNVRVQTRASLIAGLVAAVLWECGKFGFGTYLQYATGATKLYGNLALIPVFLLWVWISWVIVLFGAELAYVIQYMGDLTRDQMEREAHRHFVRADLAALAVAAVVAQRFARGEQPPSRRQLGDDLGLSEGDVGEVAEAMLAAGLLRQAVVGNGAPGYLPARPLERISLADVTGTGHRMQVAARGDGRRGAALRWADEYMQQMSKDVQSALQTQTLASLADRDEVFVTGGAGQSGQ